MSTKTTTTTRTKQITGASSFAGLQSQATRILRDFFGQAAASGAACSPGDMIVEISVSWTAPETVPAPTGEELDKLLATPITKFGLSSRATNALYQAGYQIVGDVARQSGDTLKESCWRFGDTSLRDTRSKLALSGLNFELKAPVGPLERRAALDGPAWAYLCPGSLHWIEIDRDFKAKGINNLRDVINASYEEVADVIGKFSSDPKTELELGRIRLQKRGLLE